MKISWSKATKFKTTTRAKQQIQYEPGSNLVSGINYNQVTLQKKASDSNKIVLDDAPFENRNDKVFRVKAIILGNHLE